MFLSLFCNIKKLICNTSINRNGKKLTVSRKKIKIKATSPLRPSWLYQANKLFMNIFKSLSICLLLLYSVNLLKYQYTSFYPKIWIVKKFLTSSGKKLNKITLSEKSWYWNCKWMPTWIKCWPNFVKSIYERLVHNWISHDECTSDISEGVMIDLKNA